MSDKKLFNELFKDNTLGMKKIKVRTDVDTCKVVEMNVIWKHNESEGFRMPVIIVEKNGHYQDLYYNEREGNWKLLSIPEGYPFLTIWELQEEVYEWPLEREDLGDEEFIKFLETTKPYGFNIFK